MSDHTFEPSEFEKHEANLSSIGEVVTSTISKAQDTPNPIMYGLLAGPILMPVMGIASQAAGQYVGGLGGAFQAVQGQIGVTKVAYAATEAANTAASTGMGN